MVRAWYFHCQGPRSIPSQGIKTLQAQWQEKKKKKESEIAKEDGRVSRLWTVRIYHYASLGNPNNF